MTEDPKIEALDAKKTDETGAKRPQIIDLEAEDVKIEDEIRADSAGTSSDEADLESRSEDPAVSRPDAATIPTSPLPRAAASRGTGTWRWIAAALIVGLLAGGWVYRAVLWAYLPANEMTAMMERVEAIEANGKTVNGQLVALAQSSEAASKSAADLSGSVAEAKSALAGIASRFQSYETRLAEAETLLTSAKSDLDALRNAVSASGAGTGTVDSAALAAIGQRIEALEKDVASLKSGPGGGDTASLTSALSQALADLKAKVAAGTSFQSEYDRISRMVPAADGLDVLAAHAAEGIPDARGLAGELRAAVPSLPQPETPSSIDSGSYWDWALGALSGIVTIRDIGVADWPQLAEKCAALAESGDLSQAIALLDAAEGSKPPVITQWRDRAVARLKLEEAVAKVGEAVLRQISALGGTQ